MSDQKLWTTVDVQYGESLAYKHVAMMLGRMANRHPEAKGLLEALEAQVWGYKDEADARRVQAEAQLGLCSSLTTVQAS